MDSKIRSALGPGHLIGWDQEASFVSGLRDAEHDIAVRILKSCKSQYDYATLASLEEARRCCQAAGLLEQWKVPVVEIRRIHHRKSGFMPGFEAIVAGKGARVEPSFIEKARRRWASKTKV